MDAVQAVMISGLVVVAIAMSVFALVLVRRIDAVGRALDAMPGDITARVRQEVSLLRVVEQQAPNPSARRRGETIKPPPLGAMPAAESAPAATPVDLMAFARELDASDQAQAGSASAPAAAPPTSPAALPPEPALVAAGLSRRPMGVERSEAGAALRPPRQTLLGIHPRPGMPPPPPAPANTADSGGEFDSTDEETRVMKAAVSSARVTLPSMPAVAPPDASPLNGASGKRSKHDA